VQESEDILIEAGDKIRYDALINNLGLLSKLIKDYTEFFDQFGARAKENLTQKQLSKLTGISQGYISEMANNKGPIGKKRARILGKVLGVNYKVFL